MLVCCGVCCKIRCYSYSDIQKLFSYVSSTLQFHVWSKVLRRMIVLTKTTDLLHHVDYWRASPMLWCQRTWCWRLNCVVSLGTLEKKNIYSLSVQEYNRPDLSLNRLYTGPLSDRSLACRSAAGEPHLSWNIHVKRWPHIPQPGRSSSLKTSGASAPVVGENLVRKEFF